MKRCEPLRQRLENKGFALAVLYYRYTLRARQVRATANDSSMAAVAWCRVEALETRVREIELGLGWKA